MSTLNNPRFKVLLKLSQRSTKALFVITLIMCEIIVNISNDLYLPSLPQVQDYFEINYYSTQITVIIWFVGGSCSQLFAAYFADKHGKRTTMWYGVSIFIVSTLFCATAHSYWVFCASRFMQGAAVSIIVVAGYSTVHEVFDDLQASQIASIMGGCLMIAPTMGPLIGALCLEILEWNHTFFIILLPLGLCIILLYFYMPYTSQNKTSTAGTFIGFVTLLKDTTFLRKTFIIALMYSTTLVWIINSPYIFMKIFQLSPIHYGMMQIPVFLSYLLGGYLIPYIKKAIPSMTLKHLVFLGLTLSSLVSISFIFFSYFVLKSQSLLCFLVYISLIECSMSLAFGPMMRIIINSSTQSTAVTIASYDLIMIIIGTFILTICSYFLTLNLTQIICLILGLSLSAILVLYYIPNINLSD